MPLYDGIKPMRSAVTSFSYSVKFATFYITIELDLLSMAINCGKSKPSGKLSVINVYNLTSGSKPQLGDTFSFGISIANESSPKKYSSTIKLFANSIALKVHFSTTEVS